MNDNATKDRLDNMTLREATGDHLTPFLTFYNDMLEKKSQETAEYVERLSDEEHEELAYSTLMMLQACEMITEGLFARRPAVSLRAFARAGMISRLKVGTGGSDGEG